MKHDSFNYRAALEELRPHLAQRILPRGERPKRRPPRRRRPDPSKRMKQHTLWPEAKVGEVMPERQGCAA